MHLRGKGMTMEAILPTGQTQMLSHVSNFQFNWHNSWLTPPAQIGTSFTAGAFQRWGAEALGRFRPSGVRLFRHCFANAVTNERPPGNPVGLTADRARVRSYSSAFLVEYDRLAPLGEYSGTASWASESGARCFWGNRGWLALSSAWLHSGSNTDGHEVHCFERGSAPAERLVAAATGFALGVWGRDRRDRGW
jgi:hypothetical protein